MVGGAESGNGEPDATGGVENMIGGGGMAEAGELNMFKSQLTPDGVLAPVNQVFDESFRRLGDSDTSLRLDIGTLWDVSSNIENLSSEPDNTCPCRGPIAC